MRHKRAWRAYASEANAVPDELEDGQQVVQLTTYLSVASSTPLAHVGRKVTITLSRPMLEILARLAEDVGAVEYVLDRSIFDPVDISDAATP